MLTRGHIGSGKNAVQRALFRNIPLGDDPLAAPQVNGPKPDQARSKRSRFITLTHAATKSATNFALESELA